MVQEQETPFKQALLIAFCFSFPSPPSISRDNLHGKTPTTRTASCYECHPYPNKATQPPTHPCLLTLIPYHRVAETKRKETCLGRGGGRGEVVQHEKRCTVSATRVFPTPCRSLLSSHGSRDACQAPRLPTAPETQQPVVLPWESGRQAAN